MGTQRIDGPLSEPVSLGEVKAYLRIEQDGEDALLAGMIRTARGLCEAFTGLVLVNTRFVQSETPAATIRLARLPFRALAGVSVRTAAGVLQPVVGDGYTLTEQNDGGASLRVTAPVGQGERIEIDYWAGLAADWNGVPEDLRQGILRLISHLYTHRDDPEENGPPVAVAALWRPYRRMRLA